MSTATTAADLISPWAWTGFSGMPVTGTAAANHLDLTLKILERDGWVRNYSDNTDPLADITERSTFRQMLYGLVTAIREFTTRGPHTLGGAMSQATTEGSNSDAQHSAGHCLTAILRSRYDLDLHNIACFNSWAERQEQTYDDVRDLITEAAGLARTHGPAA
ncbi:DUF6197 family protein [Streptomyces nigrescens]|uniref:DUF6197 family protein n=1 Tax=Streptomyces nigrescens TaxID=1920 RepID=UPI0036F6A40F